MKSAEVFRKYAKQFESENPEAARLLRRAAEISETKY